MASNAKSPPVAFGISSPPRFERGGQYSATERLITGGAPSTSRDLQLTEIDVENGRGVMTDSLYESSVDEIRTLAADGTYTLHFQNLKFSVKPKGRSKERLVILKDVSGSCQSGRLLSVMGRSGAGKTTLVRIIPSIHEALWTNLYSRGMK